MSWLSLPYPQQFSPWQPTVSFKKLSEIVTLSKPFASSTEWIPMFTIPCKTPCDLALTPWSTIHACCYYFKFTIMHTWFGTQAFSSLYFYKLLALLGIIYSKGDETGSFLIFSSQLKGHLLKRPTPDHLI